jgi:hypothetical protein
MIRRNVLGSRSDGRAVKWALVASTVAVLLGFYAERTLMADVTDAAPVASEVDAGTTASGAKTSS